ncbi:hypothetical protein BGX28_000431, partial [Mortierella sp. GBA30]
ASFGQARAIAIYRNVDSLDNNNDSPYWKRDNPPHSPYTRPNTPPGAQLQPVDGTGSSNDGSTGSSSSGHARKRSLFSQVDGEIGGAQDITRAANARIVATVQQTTRQHESSRSPVSTQVDDQPETEYLDVDTWEDVNEDDEVRTLIEPQYPSIDLFDEEDDELFDIGEDGDLREIEHKSTTDNKGSKGDEEDHRDQIWMVDEWEEELETDMDELMDWVEDDHALSRHDSEHRNQEHINQDVLKYKKNARLQVLMPAKVMGSNRLRDQASVRSAILEEDEASPFQRIFSESWLF